VTNIDLAASVLKLRFSKIIAMREIAGRIDWDIKKP
jgi:hypothetical protein